MVNGRRSIRRIVDEVDEDIFEVGRTVFGLLTTGVLSLRESQQKKTEFYEAVPHLAQEVESSEPFEFTVNEWALVSYIDGERDLGAVATLSGVPPHALASALKSLSKRGLVKLLAAKKSTGKHSPGSPDESVGVDAPFHPELRFRAK